jgi:membrane fusion protein (multidrug efflux system)
MLAAMALCGCSLVGDSGNGERTAKAGAEQGNGGPGRGGPGGRTPNVVVGTVEARDLADRIEAVGTARANEQADLNSTVTERIVRVNFRDGQFVPRGAVIAELVRSEQGATLNESEARLREAEAQLQRLRALQKQGFATKARVDEQQALVDVARAQSAGARSQIGDRVIRAPFSGYLSLRRVSPGQVVNAGTTIVTIVDHSRIKLDFPVPETYFSVLRPGLPIEAKAAAWPGELFRGTIDSIDPLVDPVSRAATARAILPNPDLKLRPGMLMTVDLRSRPRRALVVPELAVVGDGARSYVWKVTTDNQAVRTPIETGVRRDGFVEVTGGLSAGERVVTEGTVKLRADGPVKPVMMARPGAAPANAGNAAA